MRLQRSPAAEATARPRCVACGGAIADVLLGLGSLDCHDCRGGTFRIA